MKIIFFIFLIEKYFKFYKIGLISKIKDNKQIKNNKIYIKIFFKDKNFKIKI